MPYRKLWAAVVVMPLLAVGPMVASAAPTDSGSAVPAALSPAQASALSSNVNHRVIVVLKDQLPGAPASPQDVGIRRADEASEQNPILEQMSETRAQNVHSYTTINAVAATVSAGEESQLTSDPAVAEVVPDQIIKLAPLTETPSTAPAAPGRSPAPTTCSSSSSQPELEPQALSAIHADSSDPNAQTARSLGINGAGVKVAFIADGLDTTNPDFQRNPAYASAGSPGGSPVFTDYKDFSGEGTGVPTGGGEAFLDASSIAAQGNDVYDISQYSALPLSRPCYIRIEGVAPGASLVGLDIFGAEDAGFNSSFLQAIDYAVSVDHVNVLNESLGNNYFPDDQASLDVIKQANDAAVAAGTTVTVSSGDAGVTNTIGTPASDPNVISAGASTTYEVPSQIGYGGFQFPKVTGYLNNNISALSSSGFQQDGSTISLVAPGELNWALCSTDTAMYGECTDLAGQPSAIQESGGTSESAPLTAGTAALVIQAYAKTHGGADPTPALVKQILTSTADDINAPGDLQGSGLLDAYRAVVGAESYAAPAPANTPDTLLESTTQFNAVAPAGTPENFTENLTNLGTTSETVNLSSRMLGSYTPIKTAAVTLSDTTSPKSVDYQGITDNYEEVHFSVPPQVDRLNGSIAFKGASSALAARVRMSLVDPNGRLADYSVPQGVGNYGDAQVADPVPGLWTAYIWSRDSADGGTIGPVLFGASVANYAGFGTVSPASLSIAPGATGTVTLSVPTAGQAGDTAGSLVVSSTAQPALAIPVTLRALAPSGPTTFSGVLTGGNGRASFTGVTDYYQFEVPKGAPEINGSVTLADNPDNQLSVWLIDPSGQSQAFQTNGLVTEDSSGNLSYTNSLGANVHVVDPVAGMWTMIITFAPTVSGTALSEPFRVSLDEEAPLVTTSKIPARISAKKGAVVEVRVVNTGTAPEAYFIDGRSSALTNYNLPALDSAQATVPLSVLGNIPVFLVPSESTSLLGTATTTGTEPIQFDLGAPTGDPDVASGQGLSVAASVSGLPVSAGEWDIAPDVVGPFGTSGATPEPVTTSLTATTAAFDPAVASSTGDLWQAAIGAPLTVSPVVVQPGQSVVIPVTIIPTRAPGTTVSGVLYLDDDSLYSLYGTLAPNANNVAAIPYAYTIRG
ncbi:MAG TPA: S8 family serine peptidase [Acidimicrobiales bacterium]|nr:S8 family serine peptidase [Acidimicrobiales bacterium]